MMYVIINLFVVMYVVSLNIITELNSISLYLVCANVEKSVGLHVNESLTNVCEPYALLPGYIEVLTDPAVPPVSNQGSQAPL